MKFSVLCRNPANQDSSNHGRFVQHSAVPQEGHFRQSRRCATNDGFGRRDVVDFTQFERQVHPYTLLPHTHWTRFRHITSKCMIPFNLTVMLSKVGVGKIRIISPLVVAYMHCRLQWLSSECVQPASSQQSLMVGNLEAAVRDPLLKLSG